MGRIAHLARWTAGTAVMLASLSAFAQPPQGGPPRGPGGPGGFGGRGGFGGPGGDGILGVLQREEVQQELQLVDEQRDKVRDVVESAREQMREEMRELFSQMRDLSDEERRNRFDEVRTKMEEMNKEFETKLQKVLLPHQFDRLKQIDLQQRIQQRGANALTSGELAEALSLTDEQREKLQQRAEEVQKELQEEIAKLRADARMKMLDVLTPEQQAKLKTMMGDQFSLPDPGPPNFGGRRGRGGPGGEGGGRRRGNDSPPASREAI